MNGHEFLRLASGIIAFAMYLPMTLEIIRSGGAGQSFATWGLWAVLDSKLASFSEMPPAPEQPAKLQ